MSINMKEHVVGLLKTYPEQERKIALLHYELEHTAHTSGNEMIGAMALGHGGEFGHLDGHISDKTLYIALNYQLKADKLNADTRKEIVDQLVELEQEQRRLEYYVSLLEKRQALVIRMAYFEGASWEEIAEKTGVIVRTVHKIKNRAVEQLAEMYQFTGNLS